MNTARWWQSIAMLTLNCCVYPLVVHWVLLRLSMRGGHVDWQGMMDFILRRKR